MQRNKPKKRSLFPAELSAGLLQTAAGSHWPGVVGAGVLAALLRLLPGREEVPKWLRYAQGLWSIFVIAQVMTWGGTCWEAGGSWIPVLLLLAALWLSCKGQEALNSSLSILGLAQLGLVAVILAAGLKELRPENLVPRWTWPNGWLLAILLLPGGRGGGTGWLWSILYSAVTVGVLGIAGENGFYEMSKSLSLFGTIKRLESLAAVALTVGFVALLASLLGRAEEKRERVAMAAAACGVFFLQWNFSGMAAAAISICLWAVLPYLWKKLKKK